MTRADGSLSPLPIWVSDAMTPAEVLSATLLVLGLPADSKPLDLYHRIRRLRRERDTALRILAGLPYRAVPDCNDCQWGS